MLCSRAICSSVGARDRFGAITTATGECFTQMLVPSGKNNGAFERTGGNPRDPVEQTLDGEGPARTRESTSTAGNHVHFHDERKIRARDRVTLSDGFD